MFYWTKDKTDLVGGWNKEINQEFYRMVATVCGDCLVKQEFAEAPLTPHRNESLSQWAPACASRRPRRETPATRPHGQTSFHCHFQLPSTFCFFRRRVSSKDRAPEKAVWGKIFLQLQMQREISEAGAERFRNADPADVKARTWEALAR